MGKRASGRGPRTAVLRSNSRDQISAVSGARRQLREATIDEIAAELNAMSGSLTFGHQETFREILADTIAKDAYVCVPRPRDVFFGDAPDGERTISGQMPPYGLFFGPMRYRVARSRGRWLVRVAVAVVPPDPRAMLELPDCAMGAELDEPTACAEDPERETTLEACPRRPRGLARATDRTVAALLHRYSREVEGYWSRDARAEGLPIDYDFQCELADEVDPSAPCNAVAPHSVELIRSGRRSTRTSGSRSRLFHDGQGKTEP